jgi:hypothetical protein
LPDRKKVLKAAALAAVILVPTIVAAGYYMPKDIIIYIYARAEPVSYAVTLNGEKVIEGTWVGTGRNFSGSALAHFGKKSVSGLDFDMGVSVVDRAMVEGRFSILNGNYIDVWIEDDIFVVQSKVEPPRLGAPPG